MWFFSDENVNQNQWVFRYNDKYDSVYNYNNNSLVIDRQLIIYIVNQKHRRKTIDYSSSVHSINGYSLLYNYIRNGINWMIFNDK